MDAWNKIWSFLQQYGHFFIAVFVLILTAIPDTVMLTNKNSRSWLKKGIEGENNKLDPHEIKEMILYWGMLACVRLFSFVIVMSVITQIQYSYYVYLLPFIGMVGAGGLLVKGFNHAK